MNDCQRLHVPLQRLLTTGVAAALLALTGPAVHAQADAPVVRTMQDAALKWGPCPPFLGKGCDIAVLHGDPAKPNADVFFRVAPNGSIARHTHTSVERMVLVSGELHVKYDGHPTSVLKAGSYAYGPAGLPHTAECKGQSACVLFIAFEGPVDALPHDAGPKR